MLGAHLWKTSNSHFAPGLQANVEADGLLQALGILLASGSKFGRCSEACGIIVAQVLESTNSSAFFFDGCFLGLSTFADLPLVEFSDRCTAASMIRVSRVDGDVGWDAAGS